jgi:septal ring factor EnvC (AmiA/AmiB activator)
VARKYYDATTGKEIKEKEEFIDSLTHDSYVVQIRKLRKEFRTEVELMLSVFDQHNATSDRHILDIKPEDFPEKLRPIIRRLQHAIADKEVKDYMDAEDEVIRDFQNITREKEELVDTIKKKDKAIEEKDKSIEEKEKTIEQNEKAIEQKDKVLEEKDKLIAELLNKMDK